jgi:ectoine hydroxylase
VSNLLDHYPSRVNPRAQITPRRDPVVYGASQPGSLSPRQLLEYERDGYLALEELVSAREVGELLAAVEELRTSPELTGRPELIPEPTGEGLRSIFRVHALHATFARIVRDARLLSAARQILGSEVYVHQTRVNFKPAFFGKEFYWHSDFETWHVEDGMPAMRALSITLNLTDNTEFNGPLMVIPGSHRKFVACVGETPDNHYQQSLKRQHYGVPEPGILQELVASTGIVAPKGKAGSAVLFDCNLMHGSGSNISPHPRCNLFVVYNSVENLPREPYCGKPPRPDFIASRDFTPLS